MRTFFYGLSLSVTLILANCSMNGLHSKYENYKELHENAGSENYEVNSVFSEEYTIEEVLLDKKKSQLIIYGETNPIKEEGRKFNSLKVSSTGDIIEDGPSHKILKDGTLKGYNFYINWIINGDTTKHRYVTPFADNNYDPREWLLEFKHWYDEAAASYYFNGTYYLKIDSKWNAIDKNFEVENFNFDKHFPNKYSEIRMVEFEDRSPSYVIPPEERDSSLIKQMDYESVFEKEVESAGGWTSSTYSAGWWYMHIYMPGGDTLRIKRFSSYRSPDMKLYKISEQYGGRNDVLFIVLRPKDAHPEQVGGMYVVRPRELGNKNK